MRFCKDDFYEICKGRMFSISRESVVTEGQEYLYYVRLRYWHKRL